MTGGFSGYASVSRSFTSGETDADYSGSYMIFVQTTAPTGWVQDTTYNDYALKITSGTPGTGGSVNFSSVYASGIVPTGTISGISSSTGSTGATTVSEAQIPAHNHTSTAVGRPTVTGMVNPGYPAGTKMVPANSLTTNDGGISPYGNYGGTAHSHTVSVSPASYTSPTSFDLRIKYIDTILCYYP